MRKGTSACVKGHGSWLLLAVVVQSGHLKDSNPPASTCWGFGVWIPVCLQKLLRLFQTSRVRVCRLVLLQAGTLAPPTEMVSGQRLLLVCTC